MEYNKKRFYKYTDKRVLHKVKKQWIVVSLALLATLGGKAVASHPSAHASVNNKTAANVDHKNINAQPKSALRMKNNSQSTVTERRPILRPSSVSQAANRLHQSILRNSIQLKDRKQNYTRPNIQVLDHPSKVAKVSPNNFRKLNYKLKDDSQIGKFNIHYLIYNPKYHRSEPVDQIIKKENRGSNKKTEGNYVNQPFNFRQYLLNLKANYHLMDVIYNDVITADGSNVPSKYVPGDHNIYIEESSSTQVPGKYKFLYQDASDNYLINAMNSDEGMSGDPVKNVSSFLNSVPERNGNGVMINRYGETIVSADYMGKRYWPNQFPTLEQKLKKLPEGIQDVAINFRKNPSRFPGPIYVKYRDPDSDNNDFVFVGNHRNNYIRGHFFQVFSDVTKEVPVPAGYELDPVSKQPASDFTTNSQDPYYHEITNQAQTITLDVHKKNGSDTEDVPMYIQYVEYDTASHQYRPVTSPNQFSSGSPNTPLNSSDLDPYLDSDSAHFPHGYTNPQLVPNDPVTYNSKDNLVRIRVQPREITRNYTVEVIKRDKNGHQVGLPSDKTESISTPFGDSNSTVVDPNNFIPSDYYPDSNDHPQTITVDRNGNLNSNKVTFYYDQKTSSDMTGSYTVDLYEKQNGQYKLVKTVPKELTGKKGYTNWLTPDEFRSLIPNAADYQDADPNQESSVHLDNSGRVIPGTVSFYYDPVNRTDHMIVKYLYNGQQIGNSIPVSGRNGSSFDIRPYLSGKDVPAGYQSATPQAGDPDTFVQNGQILIDLHKGPTPSDTMMVIYKYKGNQVGPSIQVSGKDGSPFNVQPYLTRIPSGYTSPSVQAGDPTDYVPNGQVIINLQNQKRIKGSYTVKLILKNSDGTTHEHDYKEYISDVQGQSKNVNVNPTDYNKLIPSGYTPDKNNRMTSVTINGQGNVNPKVVTFYYDQKTSSDMTGQYTVNLYEKQNGQYKLVKTVPKELTGKKGYTNWLTPDEFQSLIPNSANYYADQNQRSLQSVHLNNQGRVIPGIISFYYDPAKIDHMTVKYLYNGQQIGNSIPVSGRNGSSFDITPYLSGKDVPEGYQSAIPQAGDPDKFVQNGQVLIDLHKAPASSDTMTVIYKYNGNPVGQPISVHGKDGTPFNVQPYLARIPSGYTSPSVQAGDPTDYVPNGQVIINLQKPSNGGNGNGGYTPTPSPVPNPAPNPTPNNNGGNNTPVNNGNNTPTPSPTPNSNPTPNNHGGNNTPNNNKNGGHTPITTPTSNPVRNNKGHRNPSTSCSINSQPNNGINGDSVNQSKQKLPQTGEKQNDTDIGNILMMMGVTVALLGRALDRRRYNE